jgi:hypothetical protein
MLEPSTRCTCVGHRMCCDGADAGGRVHDAKPLRASGFGEE